MKLHLKYFTKLAVSAAILLSASFNLDKVMKQLADPGSH